MSSPLMSGSAKLEGTLSHSWTAATFEFGFPRSLAGVSAALSRSTNDNKPAPGSAANDHFANSRRVRGTIIGEGNFLLTFMVKSL